MTTDLKQLVARGYDEIGQAYADRFEVSSVRNRWLNELLRSLPSEGTINVLDLGCGPGIPAAKRLADQGCKLVGVDGSARQLELARVNVPNAVFIQGEMTSVDLLPSTFDGVIAFYSIIHVPAHEQGLVLRKISVWLKLGGTFIGSFGTGGAGDWQGEWLGSEMFFSHNDDATTFNLFNDAGLEVIHAETVRQDNEPVSFPVLCSKRHRAGIPCTSSQDLGGSILI